MKVREAIEERAGNMSIIELIKLHFPEIDKTVKILSLNRDNRIESALRMRPTKQEKLSILNDLITEKRNYLEKSNIMPTYHALSNTLAENMNTIDEIETQLSKLLGLIPTEMPNSLDVETVKDLMKIGNEKIEDFDEEKFLGQVSELGTIIPTFTILGEVENKAHTLIAYLLSIDYEVKFLDYMIEQYQFIDSEENTQGFNSEFTTARQVIAIHYLLDEFNVYAKTDKTEIARFIQFLTGKETGVARINDTTIYKWVKNPLRKGDKNLDEDLRFLRNIFEKLGLQSIVAKINKEIGSKE